MYHYDSETDTLTVNWWRIVWVSLAVLVGLTIVLYAFGVFGFLFDTKVNNQLIQPAVRSRLDSDASYRRGVEAQLKGDLATYQRSLARLPQDQSSLSLWLKQNGNGNWSIMQQEEYANLEAQVQGDENAITRSATDYNALYTNPDNIGLSTFDPQLPSSLDPTVATTPAP